MARSTIGNTIVAGNTATTSGPDALGTFASLGNNLIGETDGSSGWVGSDLTGTSAQPLNPLLAPLGNYGGPTQTVALLPGSPAIDAGNNALIPAGVTTDQRGLPRIVNGVVDIGAFESSGFTIAVTSGSGQSTAVSTAFSGSAGRDGHRQQPDRARGWRPGHIHPAAERGVGDPEWKPGDDQCHRHGERHRHRQRHRRQLHRLGRGQWHRELRELQLDQQVGPDLQRSLADHRLRHAHDHANRPSRLRHGLSHGIDRVDHARLGHPDLHGG